MIQQQHRMFAELPVSAQREIEDAFRAGEPSESIARRYAIGAEAIRRHCNPEWAAHNRARVQRARERRKMGAKTTPLVHHAEMLPRTKRDAERLLRQIPPDMRSLTARIFGDPIPNDPRRQS